MFMLMTILTSVILTLFAAPAPRPALTDLVASSYPASLSSDAAAAGLRETREQGFVSVFIGSKQLVVAAYSNGGGLDAAVRLLEITNGTVTIDQTLDGLFGRKPVLSALDVDGDGAAEVVVRFETPRGSSEAWIYRVGAGRLTVISPTDKDGNSVVSNPLLLDTSGTGVLDLLDKEVEGTGDDTTVTWHRYVLKDGMYREAALLDFYQLFFRSEGTPKVDSVAFSIPATAVGKPYRLTVVNAGTSAKKYAAGAGTITLNGVAVVSPNDFSPNRVSWTVPIVLQTDNVLSVRLEGAPQSRIAVIIRHD
jgi:hypothetical protein